MLQRFVVSLLFISVTACPTGKRFLYQLGRLTRCDQGYSCPSIEGVTCEPYSLYDWKVCCYDPAVQDNTGSSQPLTPNEQPNRSAQLASFDAKDKCAANSIGRCVNGLCPPTYSCIDGSCCRTSAQVEEARLLERYQNSTIGNAASSITCQRSGLAPLQWRGKQFDCGSSLRCPAGYECQSTASGKSVCCPEVKATSSLPAEVVGRCPSGGLQLDSPSDCSRQRCPSGFQCTIINTHERRCCRNEYADHLKIEPIIIGSYREADTGVIVGDATSMLIETSKNRIIVDFGWPKDESKLVDALLKKGLRAVDITYGVTTTQTPDHAGAMPPFAAETTMLFANGYYGRADQMWFSPLHYGQPVILDASVEVVPVPGFNSQASAVFVYNVPDHGTVIIAGDTIPTEVAMNQTADTCAYAENCSEMLNSRRRIACTADWIVPGHGAMFQVTPELRRNWPQCLSFLV